MNIPKSAALAFIMTAILAGQPSSEASISGDESVLRLHLVYCTDTGRKSVDLQKVDKTSMPNFTVKDVGRDELDITVPEGYYVLTLRVGRCESLAGLRVMALQHNDRDIVITMLPRPGTQHHGELTILDVIPSEEGAIEGRLPLDGVTVYLESKAKKIAAVANVENRAYYFDNVPPGEYDLILDWVNWAVNAGSVTVVAGKFERWDISLEVLTKKIPSLFP